jgi:hypothetical protein
VALTDEHDGVGVEVTQLTGAQSGAGEHFDDEAVTRVGGAAGGGHQSSSLAVVEELRQRFRARWDVTADDRVAGRGVVPVPFDDPFEEHAQHPQPLPLGVRRQAVAVDTRSLVQPHLEVLDVAAADVSDGADVGVLEQPCGELTQSPIGTLDAVWGKECG